MPLSSLGSFGDGDRYSFRDTDRQIVGDRSGRVFKMGMRVHVLLDRIDRQQRRLQFALLPSEEELAERERKSEKKSGKKSKTAASADGERPHSSPKQSGKKQGKARSKVKKGKKTKR